jgi:hypothetical protein
MRLRHALRRIMGSAAGAILVVLGPIGVPHVAAAQSVTPPRPASPPNARAIGEIRGRLVTASAGAPHIVVLNKRA